MNLIQKSRKLKFLSPVVAVVFLSSTFFPSISYGLSTGPGQPELEGFAQVGMDNMVDLFTGDFSYNLPLMNVPGPGGGYPLNLAYSAGPNMEQEASWVGLGWSLNPGAVNRELRGLPDDFNGQEVTKQLHQKPNLTFGANISAANLEVIGADATKFGLDLSANVNLMYNNYKGFDTKLGIGFALVDANEGKGEGAAQPDEAVDKNTGEKKVSLPFVESIKKNNAQGEKKVSFANPKHSFAAHYKNAGLEKLNRLKNVGGALSSLSAPSITDISYSHPMMSNSFTFNVKTGIEVLGVSGDLQVDVFFKDHRVSPLGENLKIPAFGYLYSESNLNRSESGLMDFSLSNQSIITPSSKILAIPNHTYDVFHVKSQGVTGSVRPYRGGVSYLVDPKVVSHKKNVGGGAELNSAGASTGIGVNINAGFSTSYSGPWESGAESLDFLKVPLTTRQQQSPLLEPYYFKFGGELCSRVNKKTIFTDEGASRFALGTKMGLFSSQAKLMSNLHGSSVSQLGPVNSYRLDREKRAKVFQTLTEDEADAYYDSYVRQVSDISSPSTYYNVTYTTSDSDPGSKRIGAIHVTDEGGIHYIYGIPAKNKVHYQSTFSLDAHYGSGIADLIPKTATYSPVDNSKANKKGSDNFFSSTQTPEYAHSFLLTEVLSEDYVDLLGDGPDPVDFGTYVKFEYSVKKDHKSKSPLVGANYLPGNLSNKKDDKGSITYFEKDLYYVHTIRTKTHIAVFKTSPRADALGTTSKDGTPNNSSVQYKLDSILLYNLEDYDENSTSATPIKSVHFGYSYTLCGGNKLLNSSSGKLTLDSVWFKAGGERTKMSLSPYEFEYANNYNYNENKVDRWSCYQDPSSVSGSELGNAFGSNILYPYTTQSKNWADQFAAAWSLSKIKLPTGGEINVQYEADSYQFVQNRRAQSMYKILGFSNTASGTPVIALSRNNEYMIIELPEQIHSSEVPKYFEGVENAYFKVFMKMKRFGQPCLSCNSSPLSKCSEPCSTTPFSDGTYAYDFVDGYIGFANTPSLYNPVGGYSDKIVVQIKKDNDDYNPFSKAGWLSMQLGRQDLLDDSGISLDGFTTGFSNGLLGEVGNILSQALNFLVDSDKYFRKAEDKRWCSEMNLSAGLTSILRLNNPGNKIGGGHRVKEITISDEWAAMNGDSTRVYGQEYFYDLEDGTSSGVAQYEPQTGGEENPFRQPVKYSSEKLFAKDDLYTELPMQEDHWPSATVGYSRVTVKNLANTIVTTGGAGIQVSEFYTAKDYPVLTDKTDIKKVNTGLSEKLIDFIGNKNFFQPGFSQGFSITLNDMHGKKKSEATYSAYADILTDAPVQKTEYFYKTKGGYFPGKKNILDNEVTVYLGDDAYETNTVGVTQDTYVHLKESNERSISGDADGDIDYTVPFIVLPAVWPTMDYAYTMTRVATMNKVINKTGILVKVKTTVNGAQTITENLAFDHDTGDPVLTSMTNEYGNQIFNYSQLAKWHYSEMGGVYQNVGLVINGDIDNYFDFIVPGDLLMNAAGDKAWVVGFIDNSPQCRDETGTLVSNLNGYKIIKSGLGNNLRAGIGNIQTTEDPRGLNGLGLNLPIFESYNMKVGRWKVYDPIPYEDCMRNDMDSAEFNGIETIGVNYGSCVEVYDTIEECCKEGGAPDTLQNVYGNTQVTYITGPIFDSIYNVGSGSYNYFRARIIESCEAISRDYRINIKTYTTNHTTSNLFYCIGIADEVSIDFEDVPTTEDISYFTLHYLGGNKILGKGWNGYVNVGTLKLPDGTPYMGDFASCFVRCLQGVLNSTASNYSDELKIDTELPSSVSGASDRITNPYRYGLRGVYKPKQQLFYPQNRTQAGKLSTAASAATNYATLINSDGEYRKYFYFDPVANYSGNWEIASEVTQYDQNGNPVEEQDAIGNYSAVLYDYHRSLPVAVAKNAAYTEIAYDGFEAHDNPFVTTPSYSILKKNNHINFGGDVTLIKGDAHSGDFSIKLTIATLTADLSNLTLVNGKKYLVQAWHKTGSGGTIEVNNGTTTVVSQVISPNIEGWELIELTFIAGSTNTLYLKGSNAKFDDFRLLPNNASMKSFVYDPVTHKLSVGLDENHFGTIYNYDRDQVLIQVKKETERGIKTIQSTQRVTSQVQ